MKVINFCAIIFLACLFVFGCNPSNQTQIAPPDLTLESLKSAAIQTIRTKILTLTPKSTVKLIPTPIIKTEAPLTMIFTAPPVVLTQPSQPIPSFVSPNRQATLSACDRAEFLEDITIPDGSILTPNFEFIKTWRIKNSGSCTWTNTYHLIYARGNPMNNKGSIPLEGSVAPGDITQISISLKTPDKDGVYQSFWFLQSSQGYVFGTGENADEPFSIKIAIINSGNDKGNSTFTPNPIMTLNTGCQPNHDASQENALLRSINQERAKQGLILLIPQSQLNRAAQKHSQDMACHNFLSHSGSDGSSPLDRLTTQRYTYAQTNELIYASKAIKSNIQNVMQKWINNENDKTILFNDIYTQIGIGIFSNPNSEFENYVCVVVATP